MHSTQKERAKRLTPICRLSLELGDSCGCTNSTVLRSAFACIPTPPVPPAYPSHRPAPSMCPSSPRASHLVLIMNCFSTSARSHRNSLSSTRSCPAGPGAEYNNRSDAGREAASTEQSQKRKKPQTRRASSHLRFAECPTHSSPAMPAHTAVSARSPVRCRCRCRRACCPESSTQCLSTCSGSPHVCPCMCPSPRSSIEALCDDPPSVQTVH